MTKWPHSSEFYLKKNKVSETRDLSEKIMILQVSLTLFHSFVQLMIKHPVFIYIYREYISGLESYFH